MRRIQPDKKLVQEYVYTQKQLPTQLPVAQYIRQSSETQVKKNKQSTALQDEQLSKRLVAMGFTEIKKITLDQGKSGQMIKGDKLLVKKGLDELHAYMKNGTIGAIAAFSPSRLYRDLTRVFYTEFVHLCETYAIPVITYQRIYWPDSRQDMDALCDKFAEAARFIEEEIYGKLIPAKLQAIEESISYGGGSVPVGYTIEETEDRKYYVIYEPHARLIRYIFKRYHELSGNLPKLGRELLDTGFYFPAFQGLKQLPHIAFKYNKAIKGYALTSRTALVSILTNPAYIGWYCYNGVIISKEAHQAIVPYDDFLYAYQRLAPVTLEGDINTNKPTIERRYQTTYNALLEGVFTYNGHTAYVIENAYRTKEGSTGFHSTTGMNVCISVDDIDKSFIPAFLSVLSGAKQYAQEQDEPLAIDALQSTVTTLQTAKAQEATSYQEKIKKVDEAIAGWELDKESSRRTGNIQGLDEANTQLKRLHETRLALTDKVQFATRAVQELAKTQSLLGQAMDTWETLPFENQYTLIKMCVQSADALYLSPHILQLTVTLLPPLSGSFTGYFYLRRGKKAEYSPQEEDLLRELYPHADRKDILLALPERSWYAIMHQATMMDLKRFTTCNSSSFDKNMSLQDAHIIATLYEKHGFILHSNSVVWAIGGDLKVYAKKSLEPCTSDTKISLPRIGLDFTSTPYNTLIAFNKRLATVLGIAA